MLTGLPECVYQEKNDLYTLYCLKVRSSNIANFNYILLDNDTQQALIVDPAWEKERIIAHFRALGTRPDIILLTHSHHDHVNLAEPLARHFGSQVYMSAREIDFYHFRCTNLHSLQPEEALSLGNTPLYNLCTPGHTAGGTCYLAPGSLFTGDTLFTEGCGMCSTEGGSPEQMFDSLQMLRQRIEPHVRVYPGHSFGQEPGQTMATLLQDNLYFQIERKEQFVRFRMRPNQTHLFDFC